MRRTLPFVLTALLPAAPAIAAPKPPCPPIISDSSGDSYLPELDVVSATVRSDRKAVVVTLSVAGPLGTRTLPGSKEWEVSWILGPHAYQVRRFEDLGSDGLYHTTYVFYDGHNAQSFAASAVKVTATTIQWTVTRSWMAELRKAATKANRTFVDWHTETSSYGFRFDSASTTRTYVDAAACWQDAPKR